MTCIELTEDEINTILWFMSPMMQNDVVKLTNKLLKHKDKLNKEKENEK